jgi:hypothetical protein
MSDTVLRRLVALVEAGDWPAVSLWVALPSGLLWGRIISRAEYDDRLNELRQQVPESPGDAWSVEQTLREGIAKHDLREPVEADTFVMVDAALYAGRQVLEAPAMFVRFAHVSAWGLEGRMRPPGPLAALFEHHL